DRVVLSAPDASSLQTQQLPADASSPLDDSGTVPAISPSEPFASLPTDGVSAAPLVAVPPAPGAVDSGGSSAGASSAAPATAAGAGGATNAFLPAVSGPPKAAAPFLVVLVIVGALGGAALWM